MTTEIDDPALGPVTGDDDVSLLFWLLDEIDRHEAAPIGGREPATQAVERRSRGPRAAVRAVAARPDET